MTWRPITQTELFAELASGLTACTPDLVRYCETVQAEPSKWQLSPWGDLGGGFWVVARDGQRALWWNDIEDGWNVSSIEADGRIPGGEYWCNQDGLPIALRRLQGRPPGPLLGPPVPIGR